MRVQLQLEMLMASLTGVASNIMCKILAQRNGSNKIKMAILHSSVASEITTWRHGPCQERVRLFDLNLGYKNLALNNCKENHTLFLRPFQSEIYEAGKLCNMADRILLDPFLEPGQFILEPHPHPHPQCKQKM